MERLNNKGYMLVEIILAFAITFGIIYFLMEMVIDFKNNNDDILVSTVIKTDQTIITNKLMEYAITEEDKFDCSKLIISSDGKKITYNDDILDVIDDYAVIKGEEKECNVGNGKVNIRIPIDVKQMKDGNFDVVIDYKYALGDVEKPTCSIKMVDGKLRVQYKDNVAVKSYYFGTVNPKNNSNIEYQLLPEKNNSGTLEKEILSSGKTNYFAFKDLNENVGFCDIVSDKEAPTCKINLKKNSKNIIEATFDDNVGVVSYYFGTTTPSEVTEFKELSDGVTTLKGELKKTHISYYFVVKDAAGNIGNCRGWSIETSEKNTCPNGYYDTGTQCRITTGQGGYCNCRDANSYGSDNGTCSGNSCSCPPSYPYMTYNECHYNYDYEPYTVTYSCPEGYTKISNEFCFELRY